MATETHDEDDPFSLDFTKLLTEPASAPSPATATPAVVAIPDKVEANAAAASMPIAKDPMILEGELLIGMGAVAALIAAAKGKDSITIETDRLQRIDEPSALALLSELQPLAKSGMHIRVRGVSMLIATLFGMMGLDKIATIEIRRR